MSEVKVNGEIYQPAEGETIRDLVAKHTCRDIGEDGAPTDGERLGIAVAVDGAVVPRSRWAATPAAGEIDIVTAAQGG